MIALKLITLSTLSLGVAMSTGCKNADKLAQMVIYPHERVNKDYPPLKTPPSGINQVILNDKYVAYYNAERSIDRVIVYFYGNGESLSSLSKYNMYKALSYYGNFVVVDYPSYGNSIGTPREKTMVEAGALAVEFAREKFKGSKVVVWGWSLGSGVAALVAKKTKPDALVLVSPWSDLKSLMLAQSDRAKLVSDKWYSANKYDVSKALKDLMVETVVFIAEKDKTIPPSHSKKAFKALNPNLSYLVVVPNVKHNETYNSEHFWEELNSFLLKRAPASWHEPYEYFNLRKKQK